MKNSAQGGAKMKMNRAMMLVVGMLGLIFVGCSSGQLQTPSFPQNVLGEGSLPLDEERFVEWDGTEKIYQLPTGSEFGLAADLSTVYVTQIQVANTNLDWEPQTVEYDFTKDVIVIPMATNLSSSEITHYIVCGPVVILRHGSKLYINEQYSDLCIEMFELQLPPPEWKQPSPPDSYEA